MDETHNGQEINALSCGQYVKLLRFPKGESEFIQKEIGRNSQEKSTEAFSWDKDTKLMRSPKEYRRFPKEQRANLPTLRNRGFLLWTK